jgi:hypothetical protein
MAFKSVSEYTPFYSKMDPRVDSRWTINSNHMIVAVTHFKTYADMLKAGKTVADMKVVGLVTSHQVSESTSIAQFFEIGNKREIFIPGKTVGKLSLSSEMMESVNLLGGIYETVVEGLKTDSSLGKAMKNFDENVMFHPELEQMYTEGSDKGSGVDMVSTSNNPMDPDFQNYTYGTERQQDAEANAKAKDDLLGIEKKESTNKGALLFSIADLRMKVKFGLCFMVFQNSRRLTYSSVDLTGKNGGLFQTNSPYPRPSEFDYEQTIAQSTYDEEDELDMGDKYTDAYRILGGVFFENCLVSDYSRSINTEQIGPNYAESLHVLFSGTRNLQPTKKRVDIESRAL